MEFSILAVNEDGRWFVDDDNGFSHADNELIAGIPEMIEALVGSVGKARIQVSSSPRPGFTKLALKDPDVAGGVEYTMATPRGEIVGWLCKVFWHYFETAPKELHIRIEAVG